jgi:Putative adhesin
MRTSKLLLVFAAVLIAFSTACTHSEGRFQKTFAVNGTPDVEINGSTGNIIVRTGDVNSVQVVADIDAFSLSPEAIVSRLEHDPPLTQSGNHIRIGRPHDVSIGFEQVRINYTVTVPAATRLVSSLGTGDQEITGLQARLNVSNGTGNIRLSDFRGDARLNTGTGNIDVSSADGSLNLEAGTGDIRVQGSKVARADASTGTGEIALDAIEGELTAHAGTGNISVAGLPTRLWRVETGTGNIAFRSDSKAAYRLEAHGSIGHVDLGAGAQSVRNEDDPHTLTAEVGNGGPRVELTTGTGSIDIN